MTRKRRLLIVVVGLLIVLGLALWAQQRMAVPPLARQTGQTPAKSNQLDHVVVIVEENKAASAILGSTQAPYLNQLTKHGAVAADYFDVAKPSLPNYLALTGGTTGGITTDCNPGPGCQRTDRNLADRLEAAGSSWKEYAESMPAPCTTMNSGRYAVRHDPWVYYTDITSQPQRCRSHVVPFGQLATDLSKDKLPDYAFITPNLCSDMHDCSVAQGDAWLKSHVPAILQSSAFTNQRSLLVITWDEGSRFDHHITTIFVGPAAKIGYVSHQHYDHYALLHTIEAGFGVKPVGPNDARAPLMTDMLRP